MPSFFSGWALWEKMTFILAVAIVIVFGVGYGKLLWMSRLVKKREQIDEEKRERISHLRLSGDIVEIQKSNGIPFGPRAIESGVVIDGIWISRDDVFPPSNPKFERPRSSSSESMMSTGSGYSTPVNVQVPTPPPSRGRSQFRQSAPGMLIRGVSSATHDAAEQSPSSNPTRSGYKPRRSSQLRHAESQLNSETLGQLEGRLPAKAVVSVADAVEYEYEKPPSNTDFNFQQYSGYMELSKATDTVLAQAAAHDKGMMKDMSVMHAHLRPHAPHEQPSPVATIYTPHDIATSADLKEPLLPSARFSSPMHISFVPGELHMNTLTRKVNSGFEILPAFTLSNMLAGRHETVLSSDGRHDHTEGCRDMRLSRRLKKKKPFPYY